MVTALQLLKDQLKDARTTFEGTTADIKEEDLHKDPGGKAFSLAATYAHLAFSEDVIVHGMMQGKPSLADTTWKDKTGASSPMPPMDENWTAANEKWSKSVTVKLPQLRKYVQAVFKDTDDYINSLKDADLEKEIDLGSWGKKTLANMIAGFIIAHINSLSGEISALKGIHGSKGYPF
jgi:hypothetical protein